MGCARLRDSICSVVILVSGLVLLLGRGRSRPRILGAVCDFYQTEIGASALVISPSISEIRAGDPQILISIAPSLTVSYLILVVCGIRKLAGRGASMSAGGGPDLRHCLSFV